jgi:nucleoside-diphosphate-sugar epimerase
MVPVILLGLGFTTRRLARRFLCRGVPTFALVRNPDRFRELRSVGLITREFPENAVVVHTIPPLPAEENLALRESIRKLRPSRVVYISSTSVYGARTFADESTPPAPCDEKGIRRFEEETWLAAGDWQTLILRAAAIYGPGRGIHVRIREGRMPRTEPGGIVSRIHVDDLAALLEAGASSPVTSSWPVADDHPCASAEVAEWCGRILRTPLQPAWRDAVSIVGRQGAGRQVYGAEIRRLLDTNLLYPDYQSGILASLAEEESVRRRAAPATQP